MSVKGLVVGDLHFGIKDSKRLYDELSIVKDYIANNDLDLLLLNGDYFDCKLSLTESAAFYAVSFFHELIKLVKEKNLIFRMIQGTRSHDLNQLNMFKSYENDLNLDFKIIETVTEEDIKGLHVLYLPEEYPENSSEYYAPYREKVYNIIFGHGTWDFVAQPGQIEQSLKDTHSAPVFIWKEWKETIPNGFITFGHIHGRNTYGNKIFYPGSFTRWNFGERSEKGFLVFDYDLDNKTYKAEYVNNTIAPKYDVFAVKDLGLDLDTVDAGTVKDAITSYITESDNYRIDLSGLSTDKINILKKYFMDKPNIKIEVREDKTPFLRESEQLKTFEKYHYITKKELPINETIKRYCEEDLGVNLDIKVINEIIAEPKSEA